MAKTLRNDGLAALSGILLTLSFPKFGHWAVGWVALLPLLLALTRAETSLGALRLGYVTGAVSSLGLLYWTSLVVIQYGGLSLPVGIGIMVALCLASAVFPCLFAWLVNRWLRRLGATALLLSPLAWVAVEMLRSHTLLRFSWCLLGYSQQPNLPVIQLSRYTAVYGVSFLLVLASAVLAYLAVERRAPRRWAASAGLVLVLVLVCGHGMLILRQPLAEIGRLRVGLVQGDVMQDEKWDPALAWRNIDRHLDLTRQAAAAGARFVIWPESSVPFLYDRHPEVAEELQAFTREQGLYLLFGNDDWEASPQGDSRAFVGAKLLDPQGRLTYRYHKMRLVPFGEYVPWKPLFTLGGRYAAKLVQQVADFSPGAEPTVGSVDAQSFGTLICYEAIFPDHVRLFTARGADLIVNITNDAWYGRTSAPYQHLAMAAFRAVENGKFLVRAANTGITAVVDPRGRILEQTALFERAVVVRDVPIVSGRTFYARYGDVFGWTCFALALVVSIITVRRQG
jgi:apolipoprotein N-acyltransferase